MFSVLLVLFYFFFFQAEDGIRDHCVTGVQTCALPICIGFEFAKEGAKRIMIVTDEVIRGTGLIDKVEAEIGRASCRESVDLGGRRTIKKKKEERKRRDQ